MAKRKQVEVRPKALKFVRNVRGLTQVELAKMVGCSETLIALIETGRRQPGIDNAELMAEALDVDLEVFADVTDGDDDEPGEDA